MVDHQRRSAFLNRSDARQRHLIAVAGNQENTVQRRRTFLELRLDLHHHPILVRLSIDGRDQALAEGVIQGIVDRRRGDAEARGCIAVDCDIGLQTEILLVTGDICQFRGLAQACDQLRHPDAQFGSVGIFEGELILGAADAVFNRQVLHRLHVQRDVADLAIQFRLQAADDVAGADIALIVRFQVDQHAPGIQCGVVAIDADERRQALDCGIFQHHCRQRLLAFSHGGK